MSQSKPIRIGVYIPGDSQLLDTACIDLLAMMSKEYLSLIPVLPKHIVDIAPSVTILYITSEENGDAIPLTASMTIHATHNISHPDIQPGKLDILLVPGPDPASTWNEPQLKFLREHSQCKTTDILSVCTGILLCGAAGIINEKTVCGPRGLQGDLKNKYHTAKFVGDEYRWIQDGNLWSSGAITNGNDLVAAYARSGKHFPGPVAEIACKLADVGDRPQRFSQGQTAFTLGMAWQIIKAFFVGKK
ncbi:ThiJ/PfpI family protein [Xylogone sp. PMI_703]|nr:ThiJ/PfpI family protein [Xylogone sp. PMI_703]